MNEEMYDKLMLAHLKANLDSLESATTWIFITLLIVVLASFRNDDTLEFASFKVERRYGGPIVYAMLVGLNFQILKLLYNVNAVVNELNCIDKLAETQQVLHKHPWIFNPFSEYSSSTSIILDNFGYVFLIVTWWIGNAVAFKLMYRENRKVKRIGFILAVLYTLFGLLSMAFKTSSLTIFSW